MIVLCYLIDAIIQNECTSVHSSVYWRFQEEAKKFGLIDHVVEHRQSTNAAVDKDEDTLAGS